MPCQDTLFEMRMGSDPAFAEVVRMDTKAENATRVAVAELCRVGGLIADGKPIDAIHFATVPRFFVTAFGDEWGEGIRVRANRYIEEADEANSFLVEISVQGGASPAARAWLAKHWSADLAITRHHNERHKHELTLPRYARPGPKHDRRVRKVAEDTARIALLEARIAWANG